MKLLLLAFVLLSGFIATIWAQAPVIEFVELQAVTDETSGTVSIQVRRNGNPDVVCSVDYSTVNGTATAPADYAFQTGTLNFAAGETNKTILATITDDGLVEGDETLQMLLSNPSGGAVLGQQSSTTLAIQDNETPTVVDASFNPSAGANNDVFTVALQADGKILIGGQFTTFNNTNRSRIARLNLDGSLDLTFDPGTGADADIYAVALQNDGKSSSGATSVRWPVTFGGWSRA